jgi:uncharacterized protein
VWSGKTFALGLSRVALGDDALETDEADARRRFMNERHSAWLYLAPLGIGAGFLSGFLGIGGGLVIVPALMLGLGYPIKRAVGISLATIVPVSMVAVLTDLGVKRGNINWTMAVALTAGSLLGSAVGARLLRRLPDRPLRLLFGSALLVAAYRMMPALTAGGGGLMLLGQHPGVGDALALPIGALAGVSSTLFGLGGGIVTVPCLSVLFRDVTFHAARATSLVTIMPTSAFGAFQHQQMGTVDFAVVRRLIPTALFGAVLGVVSVNYIAAGQCQTAFAAFLALTAVRLLLGGRPDATSTAPAGRGATPGNPRLVKAA